MSETTKVKVKGTPVTLLASAAVSDKIGILHTHNEYLIAQLRIGAAFPRSANKTTHKLEEDLVACRTLLVLHLRQRM